jgi:hypothetical protein
VGAPYGSGRPLRAISALRPPRTSSSPAPGRW